MVVFFLFIMKKRKGDYMEANKTRIKIFTSKKHETLQSEVNDWLRTTGRDVIDLQYSTVAIEADKYSITYSVLIHYKE